MVRRKIGFNSRTDLSMKSRACRPTGRRWNGIPEIRVQLPVGPFEELRKVAGYGWPGRTANAVLVER